MLAFADEIRDGIGEQLEHSVTRVEAHVTVKPLLESTAQRPEFARLIATLKAQAAAETLPEYVQPDLAMISSVLASVGWNLNDDVFLSDELWAAKDTPCHKPINLKHDETKIIGHMVESRAVSKSGDLLLEKPTGEFDVEVCGVLYQRLLPDVVAEILRETEDGNLFVSMEAWFDNIAYAVRESPDSEMTIIPRTRDTAYLTKHLRAYGGSGKFDGAFVGRVLCGIRFAGKGIVHTPANPDSVILDVQQPTTAEQKGGVQTMSTTKETKPEGAKTVEEVQAQMAAAEVASAAKIAEAEKAKTSAEEAKVAAETAKTEAETAKVAAENKVKELEAQVAALTTQVAEAQAAATASELKRSEAQAELDKIAKAAKIAKRLADLKAVSTVADEAQTTKDIEGLTDEAFAMLLKFAAPKATASTTAAAEEDQKGADDTLDNVEPGKTGAALHVESEENAGAAETAMALASVLVGSEEEPDKE